MKSKILLPVWPSLILLILLSTCTPQREKTAIERKPDKVVNVPEFNADSAYQYIHDQVNFGPRVPNFPSHRICSGYLVQQLKKYGAEVIEQDFGQYHHTHQDNMSIIDPLTLKAVGQTVLHVVYHE